MTRIAVSVYPTVLAVLASLSILLAGLSHPRAEEARRIVSIGGAITEIIYALGEQDRLIARDTTSTFPAEAAELTDIGYIRALSPEGVFSVEPDLIISLEGAGPPETVALLKQAGIPFIEIPDGNRGADIPARIRAVGRALGATEQAEALAGKVNERLAALENEISTASSRPKVLFILSVQDGRILASGADTHADGIIGLAGGMNAMDGFSGYKQVSDEAILAAEPDVILTMARGPEFGTTRDQLLGHPAIADTPAGRARQIIAMDGLYLLGFGPRTADAAEDLYKAMHGGGQ